MKKLSVPLAMKSISFALMVISLTLLRMPAASLPAEHGIREEMVFHTDEIQSVHSAVKQTATAVLTAQGEEGFPSGVYGDLGAIAAIWVNGESVPMTDDQIADLEKKIYACKSQSELDALLGTLRYYNKGVDYSRFDWYWVQLEPLYSDAQIAQMRYGKREWVIVPNVVGMKAREAFQLLSDLGLLARVAYYPNPASDLPVDYCYGMDIIPGELCPTDASIILSIQAPMEINEGIFWDPDDLDFDINAIAKDIHDNGRYTIPMPNVIGLSAEEAQRVLADAGFKNVRVQYYTTSDDIEPGCCYYQDFTPGDLVYNTFEFWIRCRQSPSATSILPYVIGMPLGDASSALLAAGFAVHFEYVDEPESPIQEGCCIRLDWPVGAAVKVETPITMFIQTAPVVQPSDAYVPPSGS